jgi:hypothetical protein
MTMKFHRLLPVAVHEPVSLTPNFSWVPRAINPEQLFQQFPRYTLI